VRRQQASRIIHKGRSAKCHRIAFPAFRRDASPRAAPGVQQRASDAPLCARRWRMSELKSAAAAGEGETNRSRRGNVRTARARKHLIDPRCACTFYLERSVYPGTL